MSLSTTSTWVLNTSDTLFHHPGKHVQMLVHPFSKRNFSYFFSLIYLISTQNPMKIFLLALSSFSWVKAAFNYSNSSSSCWYSWTSNFTSSLCQFHPRRDSSSTSMGGSPNKRDQRISSSPCITLALASVRTSLPPAKGSKCLTVHSQRTTGSFPLMCVHQGLVV